MPFADKNGNRVRLPIEVDPPERVAIVGLGMSAGIYNRCIDSWGDRKKMFDETWTFNSFGDSLIHDRLFVMDDVRLLERDGTEKSKGILAMLKRHPGPVYTSRPHPDYPSLVPYPLPFVIQNGGTDYFNNVAAYAIALAKAMKSAFGAPRELHLFGIDFISFDSHDAPNGRDCCEYWLGRAMEAGIEVRIASQSTLLDSDKRVVDDKLYGYETLKVRRFLEMVDGKPTVRIETEDRPEAEWPKWEPPQEMDREVKLTASVPAG